jgi:hypothetical protein
MSWLRTLLPLLLSMRSLQPCGRPILELKVATIARDVARLYATFRDFSQLCFTTSRDFIKIIANDRKTSIHMTSVFFVPRPSANLRDLCSRLWPRLCEGQVQDRPGLVARGQMPPRAQAALSSCRLLAMAKPIDSQPDGVRPLAVGEVLHRLVARAVGLQLRDRFQRHFASLQYGVATPPGGCETIVADIRAYIEQEPQSLVLQVDLANAFNEVDRVAMFEELRDHFPELVPFAMLLICRA